MKTFLLYSANKDGLEPEAVILTRIKEEEDVASMLGGVYNKKSNTVYFPKKLFVAEKSNGFEFQLEYSCGPLCLYIAPEEDGLTLNIRELPLVKLSGEDAIEKERAVTAFLEYIAKMLVYFPDDIAIERDMDENGIFLILHTNPADTRLVVGKKGKVARAIGALVSSVAAKNKISVNFEIAKTEEGEKRRDFSENEDAPRIEAKEAIDYIVKSIVRNPDAVETRTLGNSDGVLAVVRTAPADFKYVIGRGGEVFKAITTLMKNVAAKNKETILLKVLNPADIEEGAAQTSR